MKAAIIGYSGHAYVVIDVLQSNHYELIGYCDQVEKQNNPYNLPYLGIEQDVLNTLENTSFFIGIGDNKIRSKIFQQLIDNQLSCPSVVHARAIVSPMATIDLGTIVMPGAIVNSKAIIGKAVICNSGSIIEHECIIGDYAHIAPGAVLAGNVKIGTGTFVGANAVIKQGISIGTNVTIGAGAVVLKDVADGMVVYGNPATKR
jgi:sugar O-acyltransferase (sialic acid O-acetyltransferase NeuD family)